MIPYSATRPIPSLLVVATCALLGGRFASAADEVSVATLNCEFLCRQKVHMKFNLPFDLKNHPEEERWNDREFRDARYAEAARAVADAVRRIDADVIVLTEVGRDKRDVVELHEFVKADRPHMAHGDSNDRRTFQNVAVFSTRPFTGVFRTIPGRKLYDEELDDVESERDTGVTKGMRVILEVDDQPLHVYGVHFSSERGGHEQDAQRIAQASIVRRNYLKQIHAGEHVVVAGDLNDYRGQPALRRIRGRDDIDEDLLQTGGPNFFYRKDGETTADFNSRMRDHWTYEFAGRRNQIDHVLISRSVKAACTLANGRKRMKIKFFDVPETIETTFTPLNPADALPKYPVTDHRAVKLTLSFQ